MTDEEKYNYFSTLSMSYLGREDDCFGNERDIALIAYTEMEIFSGGLMAFVEHSTHQIRQEIYNIYQTIGAAACLAIFKQLQTLLDTEPLLSDPNEPQERSEAYYEAFQRVLKLDVIDDLERTYWNISDDVFVLAYDYYIGKSD